MSEGEKERKLLMDELNIPKKIRGAFIRFCYRGIGEDPRGYFWRNGMWGEYAPVEERSRVYRTMSDMWTMFQNRNN